MTQAQRILAHLKAGGTLDPMTALREFGTNRLAARILELREAGYGIVTQRTKVRTRNGEATIAVYRLA